MKEEIIKIEDGIVWIKFHLSIRERLGRLGDLIPDLVIPDFWDGEKTVYDTLSGRWETFTSDLKEGLLGYWIGCQPDEHWVGEE